MNKIAQKSKSVCCLIIFALIIELMPLSIAKAGDRIDVRNVKYEVTGKQIVITYDLLGAADTEYDVTIMLKRRQVSVFEYTPKSIIGDFGQGKFSGIGKKIVWDFLEDFPQGLEGEDYYFVVKAEMLSSGSGILWWVIGGAAVAGGAAAVLSGGSKSGGSTTAPENGFPPPLGRPSGN